MSTSPRISAAKRNWGNDETNCTILHVDMDAFFASCEIARRPELRGKPVIVGNGHRSVVSAASYEARSFGVRSAMPVARAQQLCPHGIFLPVDMPYYRKISHEIFDFLRSELTDYIEQASVDEAYINVQSALPLLDWQSPTHIARWIRSEVERRWHVTCSIGIAANKLVAKIASSQAKPNGMLLIPEQAQASFVQMLPLRAIPGIGNSLEEKCHRWGISTVRDLAALSMEHLVSMTRSSAAAEMLFLAARGQDKRLVVTNRPEKSISFERTLRDDTNNMRTLTTLFHQYAEEVARLLRKKQKKARTISLRIRYADLHFAGKSMTLHNPTDTVADIFPTVMTLFRSMHRSVFMQTEQDRSEQDEAFDNVQDNVQSSVHNAVQRTLQNRQIFNGYSGDESSSDDYSEGLLPFEVRLIGIGASNLSDAETTFSQPTFDDIMDEEAISHGNIPFNNVQQFHNTQKLHAQSAMCAIDDNYVANANVPTSATAKPANVRDHITDNHRKAMKRNKISKTEQTLDDIQQRLGINNVHFGFRQ